MCRSADRFNIIFINRFLNHFSNLFFLYVWLDFIWKNDFKYDFIGKCSAWWFGSSKTIVIPVWKSDLAKKQWNTQYQSYVQSLLAYKCWCCFEKKRDVNSDLKSDLKCAGLRPFQNHIYQSLLNQLFQSLLFCILIGFYRNNWFQIWFHWKM